MKKKGILLICVLIFTGVCFFSTGSCASKKTEKTPLTMYIGLGNSAAYYQEIQKSILKETGIEVKFVYNNTNDTTNAMVQKVNAGDLPFDIVVSASKFPSSINQDSLVDLAAYTNLPDLFSTTILKGLELDGKIYQLPFSTRLIGFEYNKTLLEEMGWEVPHSFADMMQLKEKADQAGVVFAISGGAATGHGFNYLMHLMGAQYLNTPEGENWINGFLAGETSVTAFKNASSYFEKYADAGLFGVVHAKDWVSAQRYKKVRALFYYNILNDVYSYEGFQYNLDGTLYGVQYDEKGNIIGLKEDAEGNAVLVGDEYVLFDETNASHQQLTRYTIPGVVVLKDEYGALPWMSENGTSNCYTYYNNMYFALNANLLKAENQEKFEQAQKVLTYMTTPSAVEVFTSFFPDGYVSTSDFTITEDRLYYIGKEQIESGYLMPWYYNDFDADTIVNVGQAVNDFLLKKEGATFDTVFEQLKFWNSQNIVHSKQVGAKSQEDFTYEETALFQAKAAAISLQEKINEQQEEAEIQVSLMPYMQSMDQLPIFVKCGVVQEKIYQQTYTSSVSSSLVNDLCNHPVAISMTGREIETLCKNKYNISEDFGLNISFEYAIALKDLEKLEEEKTYWVCVSKGSLEKKIYEQFLQDGRVLLDDQSEPVTGSTVEGLNAIITQYSHITPSTDVW